VLIFDLKYEGDLAGTNYTDRSVVYDSPTAFIYGEKRWVIKFFTKRFLRFLQTDSGTFRAVHKIIFGLRFFKNVSGNLKNSLKI